MNKDKVQNQNILGTLVNKDESGIIAYSDQIYDKKSDRSLEEENVKQNERLDNAEAKDREFQSTLENITKTGEASAASNVTYNHSDSKLDATNVQQAIDEVRKRSNYNDGDNIIDFNTIHLITDNPEYICVAVDANDKILYGIKTDGQPYFGVGCPQQVKDYIDEQINKILGTDDITTTIDSLKEIEAFLKDFTNSDTLKKLLDLKANVDEVRGTTDDIYKKSNPNDSEGNVVDTNTIHFVKDNPEFVKLITDSKNKILLSIDKFGKIKGNFDVSHLVELFVINTLNDFKTKHESVFTINELPQLKIIPSSDIDYKKFIGVCTHTPRESELPYVNEIVQSLIDAGVNLVRTDCSCSFYTGTYILNFDNCDKAFYSFYKAGIDVLSIFEKASGSNVIDFKEKTKLLQTVHHYNGVTVFTFDGKPCKLKIHNYETFNELDLSSMSVEELANWYKDAAETIKLLHIDCTEEFSDEFVIGGLDFNYIDINYTVGSNSTKETPYNQVGTIIISAFNGTSSVLTKSITTTSSKHLLLVTPWYYVSDLNTDLSNGFWTTTKPENLDSTKYVHCKLQFTYDDGSIPYDVNIVNGSIANISSTKVEALFKYKFDDGSTFLDYCNAYNYHNYPGYGNQGVYADSLRKYWSYLTWEDSLGSLPLNGKEFWVTETGMNTYSYTEKQQAITIMEDILYLAALGVKKAIIYCYWVPESSWHASIGERAFSIVHDSLANSYLSLFDSNGERFGVGDYLKRITITSSVAYTIINYDKEIQSIKEGFRVSGKGFTLTKVTLNDTTIWEGSKTISSTDDYQLIPGNDSAKKGDKLSFYVTADNVSNKWNTLNPKEAYYSLKTMIDLFNETSSVNIVVNINGLVVIKVDYRNSPIYFMWSASSVNISLITKTNPIFYNYNLEKQNIDLSNITVTPELLIIFNLDCFRFNFI